jgi:glycosyltransferase involved in cell wall biosynthesis
MKIAIVNDHFSSGPGGQHRIQTIAQGFSKLGHEVLYLSPYGVSKSIFDLDLSNTRPCNLSGPSKYIYPYFNDFFGIFKKLVKTDSKLDLLIISLPNTMSKSLNVLYGLSKKVPTSYDFGGLWTSFFDRGKIYGQGSLQFKLIRPVSQLGEDALAILSSRLPDIVTVPTTGMDQLLEKLFRRRIHVIYQPVDTSVTFNPLLVNHDKSTERVPEKYRRSRLVAIGVKGDEWFIPFLETLVQKCKKDDITFMVMGSFPKAEDFFSKKKHGEKVFFTGNIPYQILPYYIANAQCAVVITHPDIASIWFAPHNIAKIADYMAMGKPVVTDALSASDYIENGTTGFIVRTKEGLISKTISLLNDDGLLYKMGEAARRTACEKFDNIKVAKRYLALMEPRVPLQN